MPAAAGSRTVVGMTTDRLATRIDRITTIESAAAVEPLLEEYLDWASRRMVAEHGPVFADRAADIDRHHDMFRAELPKLIGSRGRLLVAGQGDVPVGVGALKPVDDATAEIKRMYVSPSARGRGVARSLLERLLADARGLGYRTARLETADFMTEAHALYRSLGFVETTIFDGSETAESGIESFILFMELTLH